jgi:hypothetical protein
MMVTCTAGDLLGAIHRAIMNDEGVRSQFHLLLLGLKFEDTDVSIFLEYVLRKYKRMRGRWFVKAVRSQTADGADAVSKMTTRNGVAAADKAAKAAGAAVRKIKDEIKNEEESGRSEADDTLGRMYTDAETIVLTDSFDDHDADG